MRQFRSGGAEIWEAFCRLFGIVVISIKIVFLLPGFCL